MEEVEIIAILKIMEGGSTGPLLVDALKSNGDPINCIVKLYKAKAESSSFPTLKEVIVNFLAGEFELRTPKIYLTEFSKEIVTINKTKVEQFKKGNIKKYDLTKKFTAFEYLTANTVGFNDTFDFDIKVYSNIYAFDFLIFNNDRGGHNNKPNLLVDDEGFILIDHELSLYFIDQYLDEDCFFDDSQLERIKNSILRLDTKYNYYKHLFHSKLMAESDKEQLFDDFFWYLDDFSLVKFRRFLNSLTTLNFDQMMFDGLIEYLAFVKRNPRLFRQILENSIENE